MDILNKFQWMRLLLKMVENEDYEFIPKGDDQWHVRLLSGPFPETVISYGKVSVREGDGESAVLKYDFTIHDTPDPDLTSDNAGLQAHAGDVLVAIIESAEGSAESEH